MKYGGVIILRVISGTAKGHKLKTVTGLSTRPTSDRVKETLFNIIAGYIQDADILDLYAGTGSLGIEALSRGAAYAVFVDKSSQSLQVIRYNIQCTHLEERTLVLAGESTDAVSRLFMNNKKFDVILLDPPYHKNLIHESLISLTGHDIVRPNGIVVAEHDKADNVPEKIDFMSLTDTRIYGNTALSFYKRNDI